MKNWTSLRKIFLLITDPELQQIVCGIAVRSYYFNLYFKNAKKLKNCRRATIVFTCKFCDIFSVYTVIFQHFFQSSVTRPMKSIFELRFVIVFFLGRAEAACQRCSRILFKKDSGKDAFLWNTFFTYTHIFFIISNIVFASACFCSISYLTIFLKTMQIYFLSNVFLLKIGNFWMTSSFCLQQHVA